MAIYSLSNISSDVRKILDRNDSETSVLATSVTSVDIDTLSLDDIVAQKVLHAAHEILFVAPLHMIDWSVIGSFEPFEGDLDSANEPENVETPSENNGTNDDANDGGSESEDENDGEGGSEEPTPDTPEDEATSAEGKYVDALIVPSDFLRIYRIKYWDWDYGVSEFVMEGDDAAKIVKSSFAGIRPNQHRPLVVMVDSATFDNGRVLRCYGQGSNVKIQSAKYVKIPSLTTLEGLLTEQSIKFPAKLYKALLYKMASYVESAYKNIQVAQMYDSLALRTMGLEVQEQDNNQRRTQR